MNIKLITYQKLMQYKYQLQHFRFLVGICIILAGSYALINKIFTL